MKPHYFVTGTDTEVGKTAIACGLLAAAAEENASTLALKPVAAGCDNNGQNADALALMSVMTASLDYGVVNPIALLEPVAPHIAAEREQVELNAAGIAEHCRQVLVDHDQFAVVEGAGGWRVPLNGKETLADVACQLDLRVVMVVGMRLGCINHALLTAEAIALDGLELAGWVANHLTSSMNCRQENVEYLKTALPAPLLGEVPFLDPVDSVEISQFIDIKRLF